MPESQMPHRGTSANSISWMVRGTILQSGLKSMDMLGDTEFDEKGLWRF